MSSSSMSSSSSSSSSCHCHKRRRHHRRSHSHCKKPRIPKGIVLRGYGNATPKTEDGVTHCRCYNDCGKEVGFLETYKIDTPGAFGHRWILKNGSSLDVHFTENSDLFYQQPVTGEVVAAFPELAPYINRPDAIFITFVGNHNKCNPTSLQWEATGEFKHSNYVEVRCVFLAFVVEDEPLPAFQQCLGCHWFIGKK